MMRFFRSAAFVLALYFVPSLAQAADAAPPPPDPALAQRLADLLDPVDLVVAMDRRFAVQNLDGLPPTHPFASIRQRNPKLFAVIAAAWQDAVEDLIRRRYPDKRARVVHLFQASLSQDDLAALVDYYESPVGRKVVAVGFAKMNAPAIAVPPTMTNDEFESAASEARAQMVEQLSPEEAAAVVKFALSPVVARFEPVNHQRLTMSLAWANSLAPELQRVVNARIKKAMRDYMSAHPLAPH
jgi:hypothetical protein